MVEALLVGGGRAAQWRTLVKPGRKVRLGGDRGILKNTSGTDVPALTAEVIATGEFGERTLQLSPPSSTPLSNALATCRCLVRISATMNRPAPMRQRATSPATRPSTRTNPARPRRPPQGCTSPADTRRTEDRGVEIATLTLHVGLGTFQPVRVAELADIRLHSERYTLPPSTADALNRAHRTPPHRRRRHHHHPRAGACRRATGCPTSRFCDVGFHYRSPTTRCPPPLRINGDLPRSRPPFRLIYGLLTNFHLPELFEPLMVLVAAFALEIPIPEHPASFAPTPTPSSSTTASTPTATCVAAVVDTAGPSRISTFPPRSTIPAPPLRLAGRYSPV